LLEKSRVVGCTDVERNYHIFYFIMRGATDAVIKKLGLMKPDGKTRKSRTEFKYLQKGKDKDELKDKADYEELAEAFHTLGFTEDEVDSIHRIVAAVLHIGEILLDNSTYDDGKNSSPVSVKNKDKMKEIANLLGVDNPDDLITELVYKPKMPGASGRAPDKPQNCLNSVESLAKGLYDNLFNWLVAKMNIEILPDELKSGDAMTIQKFQDRTKTIGLLDIFGFENFELNQFEQLCINFVNEKLHNLYISSVFGNEKKEMER